MKWNAVKMEADSHLDKSFLRFVCAVVSWGFLSLTMPQSLAQQSVDFQRDIRPILSANCFQCHGPDENTREAELRLDQAVELFRDRGGYSIVDRDDPSNSEFLYRIVSQDDGERMPPVDSNKQLSDDEISKLTSWIEQGAEYAEHWSFQEPESVPTLRHFNTDWTSNPIDTYILRAMTEVGLAPNPPADRLTLARRLSLDLTGLPLAPEQAEQFRDDASPDAYERLVDRLLASPAYGEKWGRLWLDLARYSDTNGYEKDLPRNVWPYRDWVIDALNDDLPYDQFTIKQLAGDMLGGADVNDRIATGFHRNTMTNQEGGVDPQEFRYYSVVDRINTTGTIWLGLTVGCAQCHTHKFDPLVHSEYFSLFGLLNNADEPSIPIDDQTIQSQRAALQARIDQLEAELIASFPLRDGDSTPQAAFERSLDEWVIAQRPQFDAWSILQPTLATSNLPITTILNDQSVLATGDVTKSDLFQIRYDLPPQPLTGLRLEVIADPRLPYGGPGRSSIQAGVEKGGDFYLSHFEAVVKSRRDHQVAYSIAFDSATHSYAGPNRNAADAIDGRTDTGWGVAGRTAQSHWAVFTLSEPIRVEHPERYYLEVTLRHESFYPSGLGRFRLSATDSDQPLSAQDIPAAIADLICDSGPSRSDEQATKLADYFRDHCSELANARQPIDALKRQLPQQPTTLVMQEREPDDQRPTFRHHRGEFLQPREEVVPGTPSFLPPMTAAQPPNRLGLARWLVDSRNPLTARVTVNRHWHAFFGRGLVRTLEDFGYQGESPTHPDLLDWLALELLDSGWSLKQLHRRIVLSQTYQQSSAVTESHLRLDPENTWLARSPRTRLEAEVIRDSILAATGLLTHQIGGPSVFPPQPPGITEATYSPMRWRESQGSQRFRRGIYTFNKRTAPYAMFTLFDAPTGEACIPRRIPSNTPMQALTMLNDEFVMECARALARDEFAQQRTQQVQVELNADADVDRSEVAGNGLDFEVEQAIRSLFQRVLTRAPRPAECDELVQVFATLRSQLQATPEQSQLIARTGTVKRLGLPIPIVDANLSPSLQEQQFWSRQSKAETDCLAALVLISRALLNLDEAICKP